MNGFDYILAKQIGWAHRNKIKLVGSEITKGRQTYTKILDENLFEPLSAETRAEFDRGDGGELKGSAAHSAKMCAVHSSSIIGANVFQYWKNKAIYDIAYAIGLCKRNDKSANKISFEQKFKISSKFRFDPNIDIVIFNDANDAIKAFGIECKFSEAYSSRKHSGLKERYLIEIREQWEDISNLLEFAKIISPDDNRFQYLHSAQLIKHILGLKKQYGKSGFKLAYIWYDMLGYEGCKHRNEIEEFKKVAKLDKIAFYSMSYQELIMKLRNDFYKGNERYVDYLIDRYL